MNADILKPYLEQAIAAFPGHEVAVKLELSSDTVENARFQCLVKVPMMDVYGWGETMGEAMKKAESSFPSTEKIARRNAANALREKAIRIESGEEPA